MHFKSFIGTVTFLFVCGVGSAQDHIRVAAASDLKFAMDSVISAFRKINGGTVHITYGSSGKLTEQIINGAPFDIFFSADIAYPIRLEQAGKTSSVIYRYAKGRIVLWSRKFDPAKNGMKILTYPQVKKIAIANPAHAPYGKRARESLMYYKMIPGLETKIVYGDNISQTAQFVSSGAADAGIIALSLALSPNMIRENGSYYLIDEKSHQPLVQAAVITRHGKGQKLATDFFEFVQRDQAISILLHFGFTRPGHD